MKKAIEGEDAGCARRFFYLAKQKRGSFALRFYAIRFLIFSALGHPPEDSIGISYAVQTLLYERTLFFFRAERRGF